MCYNCGCEEPDNNMGKSTVTGASLIESSFVEMAKEWEMSVEEAKKNVYKLLKKQLKLD